MHHLAGSEEQESLSHSGRRTVEQAAEALSAASTPVDSADATWPWYRDEVNGIAFSYPPDFHPAVSAADESRSTGGWAASVDLVPNLTAQNPRSFLRVLVFPCDDQRLDPLGPCRDGNWYRRVCDRLGRFRVGNATALQCVSYGRGACHWSAIVLRRHSRVEVMSPAADSDANEHELAHTRGVR